MRGGQVLVSAAAAGLLPGVDLVDLGEHRLKDLSAPEHIFQLAWCGSHLPLRTLPSRRHNLPSHNVRASVDPGLPRSRASRLADPVRPTYATTPGVVCSSLRAA